MKAGMGRLGVVVSETGRRNDAVEGKRQRIGTAAGAGRR
jgi:hypothetical protein